MTRPRKQRRVCFRPSCTSFGPEVGCEQTIVMSIDEFETIRLIDYEGLTQEQCGEQMEVARTTIQAIYSLARKKMAQCIVEGKRLHIDGGDVLVCDGQRQACRKKCCRKERQ
ncbi:putative DNA-binding protein (UPF0251 family) [Aequitasia blattaphilus]|uniref:DUF134 domain-containing protein n=1 Tax=Aequitasia blattaphilus TaxID=2949332 RepID=A0ABT1EB44_9FIRM|nr:DUF134 domain-containing protein [Aequitasia blattaphilus]MCP1102152.1 DUF134 domain-containing protein [Aequitasia blattaphilus]MCR8614792.1 DUF134 domain-containing protein [Aequitasia blattaphilus]